MSAAPHHEVHAVLELDGSPWGPLAFGAPRRVISAATPAEVLPALRAVEAAAGEGLWAVGWIAYEAAPGLDRALVTRAAAGPLLWFGLHDAPLEVAPASLATGAVAGSVAGEASSSSAGEAAASMTLLPEHGPAEHATAVATLREAIAAGTAYQVNLTLRLTGRLEGDPLALYHRLRAAQGGGQTAYVRGAGRAVVSASPELFLARVGDRVTTRPMKGTARRGRFPAEDAAVRDRLVASEKDRAENVMIADLLRNDLGRVAATGSVRVASLFDAARLRTVWQLTSTVEARLRPGAGLADLLAATFPCGSVTGAPKASAMGLIAALERSPRGAYCGAVGAVAPGGDAVFNVAIRTVEVDLATGAARYGTGGGITWASDAAAEWDEALAKAAVLTAEPGVPTLLETMRLEGGRVALLDLHLARLGGSAAWLGVPVDPARLSEVVRGLVEAEGGDARLRLLLSPDGTPRLERLPLPAPLAGPAAVAFAATPVDERDPALFHKTTRRALYEARRAERPEAFDVILSNRAGRVTETTIGNLVLDLDGERVTPPLEDGLLPGVFRASLLAQGEVRERPLRREDVLRARRCWLVNALRGWVPLAVRRGP